VWLQSVRSSVLIQCDLVIWGERKSLSLSPLPFLPLSKRSLSLSLSLYLSLSLSLTRTCALSLWALQREGETELQVREVLGYKSGTGRMYHDVSIGRLKDEAFRIWLFNAAWLLCKNGAHL
jgi:hypothetical protein